MAFDPWGPYYCVGFVFQRVGKIHDRAARLASCLPISARAIRIRREKSEINFVELFGTDALDERNLILQSFKLSQRFIVVQKFDIQRWKIAVAEHFRNFFSLERARADNRKTVKVAAAHRFGMGER